MSSTIRFRVFAHSWISDWGNSDAHFLRGLVRELLRMGHDVRCYEELGSWSLTNLVDQEGEVAVQAIDQFRSEFPELDIRFIQQGTNLPEALKLELRDADVVIIHEKTHPEVANAVLSLKPQLGFRCLLHDTHLRAATRANEILRFHLQYFDGVLVVTEAIRRIYCDGFGVPDAWTFHQAADVTHFYPRDVPRDIDMLWVADGNDAGWTSELREYLEPVAELRNCKTVAHGSRYLGQDLQALAAAGIEYRGYLPDLAAPEVYSRAALSLHFPRRPQSNGVSSTAAIQVFEALACGSLLLCAPWNDQEQLFRPGEDYLIMNSGAEMKVKIQRLLREESVRQQIGANGRKTILQKHTCAHRAQQLVAICEGLS